MSEEITHPDGRIEHPQVKYEKTDASFGAIAAILLGAMVFAAFVQYVILLYFHDVRKNQAESKESPYPLGPSAEQLSDTLPRDPVLEEVDRRAGIQSNDNYRRQIKRELRLNSYGPTEDGFVHIPIERAIDLMEQEGQRQKSRPPPASAEEKKRYEEQRRRSSGLVDYGESNSGRMFRRGRQK